MMQTPVVLTIFNRPELTARVLAEIRRARPARLFVFADGPRPGSVNDAENCAAARAVIDRVDWDCEVIRDYAEVNLGCQRRVSSGIDRVFSQAEAAIMLEDDGVPHPDFFRFCEELLDYYRADERIMHISGSNFQFGRRRTPDSYYFSRYNHCVGWATWRRAWRHFDVQMKLWPEFREQGWLGDVLGEAQAVAYWQRFFQLVYEGKIDSWAGCWTLACWMQNGLTILPNVNLISNLGFGAAGTHTRNRHSRFARLPVEAVGFPLQHPPFVVRDAQADEFTQQTNFRRGLLARFGSRALHAVTAFQKAGKKPHR